MRHNTCKNTENVCYTGKIGIKNVFTCQPVGDDELASDVLNKPSIDGYTQTENAYIDLTHMTQEDQCLVRELSEVFPLVVQHLKNINRYDDWMALIRLISEGKCQQLVFC